MKIIWKVPLRSYGTKSFPVYRDLGTRQARSRYTTGEISVAGIMFSPYKHNVYATFPLSGKTFCRVSNFSIVLFDSATSQSETLPGNRDNVCPYEQNKIIWLVEIFLANRDNISPYEQALTLDNLSR